MRVRFHVLAACGLAILASLVVASTLAAHAHLTEGSTPSYEVMKAEPESDVRPSAVTPEATTTAPEPTATAPERQTTRTVPDSAPTQVYPVPGEALPATKARAVEGPGSLLGRQPTPQPHRPTIILDPGHGRGDPGAVHYGAGGVVDLTEAESNLAIAEHLQRFLEEKGYDVYVTRVGFGKRLGPGPLAQFLIWADLWARVQLADAVEGDLFVSIHSNGSVNPRQSGAEIWYCGQHEFGDESARLAELTLDAAMQGLSDYGYDAVRRGLQEDSTAHHSEGFCQFLVTREVQMPAILTELLFLTNDADAAVLKDDRAREAMAQRIAEAIDRFMRERGSAPAPPSS